MLPVVFISARRLHQERKKPGSNDREKTYRQLWHNFNNRLCKLIARGFPQNHCQCFLNTKSKRQAIVQSNEIRMVENMWEDWFGRYCNNWGLQTTTKYNTEPPVVECSIYFRGICRNVTKCLQTEIPSEDSHSKSDVIHSIICVDCGGEALVT